MLTNTETGKKHTAADLSVYCIVGGIIIAFGGFFQKLTGVSWEATTAFAAILFALGGKGIYNMSKAKNGGSDGTV